VANRWRTDGGVDVLVMAAVANREITFEEQEDGRYRGDLSFEVRLESYDGQVVKRELHIVTSAADAVEVGAPALFQIGHVVLENVPFRSGLLTIRLVDENQSRRGLLNLIRSQKARSETAFDWSAETEARVPDGLAVGDPIFLAGAPIGLWRHGEERPADTQTSIINEYLHPTRRYGLEQEQLQVYFELYPGLADPRADAQQRLLVQVHSREPDYVLQDTLALDPAAGAVLASGRPAGVFYELDVNILPPGTFQLSIAPLGGRGRPALASFDVIWRLALLNRHADELLGEARTVFRGQELERFLEAGMADREVMLERFWQNLDPDPETPVNEVYLEFRRRVAYVREHLGGFGRTGAADPRGEVYILLGPPDRLEVESIPLNADDQTDARIKVYERFAPDRAGETAKGESAAGSQSRDYYDRSGGLPMPYSLSADKDIQSTRTSSYRLQAYELWRYDNAGRPLFPNKYTEKGMGLGFLFVDQTGTGSYVLESSNAFQIGD
jgi:GWxTD domain-containing protein